MHTDTAPAAPTAGPSSVTLPHAYGMRLTFDTPAPVPGAVTLHVIDADTGERGTLHRVTLQGWAAGTGTRSRRVALARALYARRAELMGIPAPDADDDAYDAAAQRYGHSESRVTLTRNPRWATVDYDTPSSGGGTPDALTILHGVTF